jgi:hypothetical protein
MRVRRRRRRRSGRRRRRRRRLRGLVRVRREHLLCSGIYHCFVFLLPLHTSGAQSSASVAICSDLAMLWDLASCEMGVLAGSKSVRWLCMFALASLDKDQCDSCECNT